MQVNVSLTEDNLKLTALKYLKRYYREYPRTGDIKIEVDMRGEGGIIVDGLLTFPREDGTWFTATVEATSAATSEEVKFLNPLRKIFWDALALSTSIPSAVFLYQYLDDPLLIQKTGNVFQFLLIFLETSILWLIYVGLFIRHRKYRYIYALAQFGHYHADEQWIVIGDDVFPHPEDKFFIELKNQCVKKGAGLLLVRENELVNLLIAPPRMSIATKTRKRVLLLPMKELMQKVQQVGVGGKINGTNIKDYLYRGSSAITLRFVGKLKPQMLVSAFAVVNILTVFLDHNLDRPFVRVNEKQYAKALQLALDNFKPESPASDSVVNSWVIPAYGAYQPYLDAREKVAVEWLVPEFIIQSGVLEKTNLEGIALQMYDCSKYAELSKPIFVIQIDGYFPASFAQNQAKVLRELNIKVTCLWLGCFSERTSAFFLSADRVFPSRESAKNGLQKLEKSLKSRNLNLSLEVVEIKPLNGLQTST